MLTSDKESEILKLAYVPEQIPKLMSFLSKGKPELLDEKYLLFRDKQWLIFIGYPLRGNFDKKDIENKIKEILKKYKPDNLWIVAEDLPENLLKKFKTMEEDYYYKLDLKTEIDRKLIKIVEKASIKLKVRFDKIPTKYHINLINEFLNTKNLPANIKELYIRIPEYVRKYETAFLLSSYSKDGKLTAFYAIDMSARQFSAYLIGCYSKENYIPYSSDLLMFELINFSEKEGKKYVNLGIGVNEGIRRFKKKWGGTPFLRYRTYEYENYSKIFDYFLSNYKIKL